MHALAGLEQADGTAVLDGEDLLPLPPQRRRVGVVFQDQRLFPHLTALDNVAFGPRAAGLPRAAARRTARSWLERLGVADLADRRPRRLSGGQAQRVAIARALAAEPRLLLLDEPFAGLDVGVAAALRIELTRHLAAFDGVTLLVTHDALDALTLATVVAVLDDGRLVQAGPRRRSRPGPAPSTSPVWWASTSSVRATGSGRSRRPRSLSRCTRRPTPAATAGAASCAPQRHTATPSGSRSPASRT
ncbi:ATP-binding cassette domain-containing protein [Nocardioides sp. TF02-7]|uniref:ABC transporter ATP-binding protein n=1 Tax=Nocardioides sp. TF02-7 TaxID=2917724 RepID=UPI001F05FE80|nr:ATP-binding cassette domain-containing protein [Nocardioides sp. TF02-7]UMG91423.1 ATP-binding cassette domain-containing protein [Nocardioides sp. TF02-7]